MQNAKAKMTIKALVAGIALVAMTGPVFAQRPLQAKFDKTKTMTLTGIVTNVDWKNPQAHVFINVKDGSKVVTGGGEDPLTLWDVPSRERLGTFGETGFNSLAVQFDEEEDTLVTLGAAGSGVLLFDILYGVLDPRIRY